MDKHIIYQVLDALEYAHHAPVQVVANDGKVIEVNGEVVNSNNNEYVRMVFYDNGTGISTDIFNKICDPFFTSKPPGEGTGLGLSISHSIIKDHGGRLNFDSVAGDYTKVIIDLPVPVEDNFENQKENSGHRR